MLAPRTFLTRLVSRLSSLRLASLLMLLLILACAIGGVVPQASVMPDAEAIYRSYGLFWYRLITRLKLDDVFASPWFFALVGTFALNLSLCTGRRLGRSLRQVIGPIRWPVSLASVRTVYLPERVQPLEREHRVRAVLHRLGFRTIHRREEAGERIWVMGCRRRRGVFGADVVHVGILIVLLGALLGVYRQEGSFRVNAWQMGERLSVDALITSDILPYDVQVDAFGVETYDETSRVKDYWADVVLWDEEQVIVQKRISINQPLMVKGTGLYVWRYGEDANAAHVSLQIVDPARNLVLSEITLGVGESISIPGSQATVTLLQYDPSRLPDERHAPPVLQDSTGGSPAALVQVNGETVGGVGDTYRAVAFPFLTGQDENREWAFLLADVQIPTTIDLRVSRNPGYPLFWWGLLLVMIGLAVAFYFRPSTLMIEIQETQLLLTIDGHRGSRQAQRFAQAFSSLHGIDSQMEVDE